MAQCQTEATVFHLLLSISHKQWEEEESTLSHVKKEVIVLASTFEMLYIVNS